MDQWATLAGCLALTSVALSMYEISMHLCNFTKPYLQRYIIRILLMVPIYSLNAWIAMVLPQTGLYLDSLREAYESFVIYSFMKYLFNFLNYDTNLQQYIDFKPGQRQIPPLCCLPPCVGGRAFLLRCKHGILQYVLIRPITTLVAFTSQQFGFYGEGNYNPLSGYTYPVLLLVNNASQVLAMYCLVIFYTGYQRELHPMRPLAKFFSIKLVVFFSFFQSVVISGLLEIPMVRQMMASIFPELQGDKVALGRKAQELLICVDMLAAAVGHLFAFTYRPFTEPSYSRSARLGGAGDSFEPKWGRRANSSSPVACGATQPASEAGRSSPVGRSSPQLRLLARSSSEHLLLRTGPHEHAHHDDEQADNQRTCCGALCSILDFSEDKSDFSEHFTQISAKLRQLFSFRRALPAIVTDPGEASRPARRQLSDDRLKSAAPPPPAAAQDAHQAHDDHADRQARRLVPTADSQEQQEQAKPDDGGQGPKRNYLTIR